MMLLICVKGQDLKTVYTIFLINYPGGEKQRVSIARALVNHPDVIFSDEATGNLDYKNSIQVMDMLVTCCSEYEASLVFVTHDNSLIHYADRIVNINAEADNV